MRKTFTLTAVACFGAVTMVAAAGLGPPGGVIWADGTAYRTIGTNTNLPSQGPKDQLYVFDNLEGQNAVSESKPGDSDYNGGRWQVLILAFTDLGLSIHDPDGDGVANFELTSWEMVQAHIALRHLEQIGLGPSFVCPVIKQ